MKRTLIAALALCVAVGAMLAFAGGAKASVQTFSYHMALASTEATTQPAAPVTLHLHGTIQVGGYATWGDFLDEWNPAFVCSDDTCPTVGDKVTVTETFNGSMVDDETVALLDDGTYTVPPWELASKGVYTFTATTQQWRDDGDDINTVIVTSNTVTVYVDATPPVPVQQSTEGSVFLCYSVFQVDPGVWLGHIAAELMAGGGYWQPYAVKGNVPFGTNIGDYHLVCNLATGQAAGLQFVGGGGDVSGPEAYAAAHGNLGWYPLVP